MWSILFVCKGNNSYTVNTHGFLTSLFLSHCLLIIQKAVLFTNLIKEFYSLSAVVSVFFVCQVNNLFTVKTTQDKVQLHRPFRTRNTLLCICICYFRGDALKAHKQTHLDKSKRSLPFSCDQCTKAFRSMVCIDKTTISTLCVNFYYAPCLLELSHNYTVKICY